MKFFSRLLPLFLLSGLGASAQTAKPRFNHQTIFVTDLARASKFYSEVMMLDSIPEPFHDHKHTWYRVGDHSELHVVAGAKEDIPHDINIHLAFAVGSVPDFMKHLEKFAVQYGDMARHMSTIQPRPDGVKQIYFQDPDGYWIEVNDDKF